MELLGLLWGLLGALQGGNVAGGGGALQGGTVADRYASSATQTKPFRDRPTAAALLCPGLESWGPPQGMMSF